MPLRRDAKLCYSALCYAMLCYAVQYAMLCYAMHVMYAMSAVLQAMLFLYQKVEVGRETRKRRRTGSEGAESVGEKTKKTLGILQNYTHQQKYFGYEKIFEKILKDVEKMNKIKNNIEHLKVLKKHVKTVKNIKNKNN